MGRPVTLFTGQWADMEFADVCNMAGDMGYDGLEIACWGDHLNLERAANDDSYVSKRKKILKENELDVWAIGTHIVGQCVGARYDSRLDNFAPDELSGKPEKIKKWAVEQMKYAPKAANNLGCEVVTGFTGSPIWKFFYSFPQTSEETIEKGFEEIVESWTPIFDAFDEQGVKFALEVHPTEIAFDYYTTKRLLEKFDYRETLGINFDPSHLIWQGVEPHLFLRDFSDRTYHVHMKDASVNLDGRASIMGSHLPFGDTKRGWNFRSLGHGDVNFEAIIRELNDMGYTGPLSVEWEDSGMDRKYGAKEAVDFVKQIDFEPSSLAFDESMKE
ncbi:sugar phosphate isomerase/epimerase [Candidatus Bipolaricaulota bacterium]|nr:sugar phosphate isomerase/epimerase [Candidatus Bipolaricaulota bacterium]